MSLDRVSLEGTVHSDGTLELDKKLDLPPGRVHVTVQPQHDPQSSAEFFAMMERIWADQTARGHVPRCREEIDAEINQLRDEAEEEVSAVERLHDASRIARQHHEEPSR